MERKDNEGKTHNDQPKKNISRVLHEINPQRSEPDVGSPRDETDGSSSRGWIYFTKDTKRPLTSLTGK
jgi:hypothetical protein